ncbi:MAG: hypothetical protein BV458_00770 [Thermoplasmata archaeon M9B2D]|nr:MAG: hypothetical protein BV458_00770 [Thermoplasmata archaeon M9B2D]
MKNFQLVFEIMKKYMLVILSKRDMNRSTFKDVQIRHVLLLSEYLDFIMCTRECKSVHYVFFKKKKWDFYF